MKVLMIDHFLPESVYSYELAKELSNYVDLTLLCRKNVSNIDIAYLNLLYGKEKSKLKAAIQYGKALYNTRRIIKKGKYDILHIQDFQRIDIELPMILRLKKNYRKLVFTVHNVLPHEFDEIDKKIYRQLYIACDGLVTHNESSKKKLLEQFPELLGKKISVIPHGSYTSFVAKRKKIGTEKVFLQFGAVREYKGIDYLIQAISLMKPEIREKCKFIIAGKQDRRIYSFDIDKRIKELGIEGCTERIDRRIEDEELPKLYDNIDFCLFPYREIYGSGALLMAYSFHKPVIASNVDTFVEETNYGECGLLFKREDPEDFARTLEMACQIDDAKYQHYIDRIESFVSQKYCWRKSASLTNDFYREILM